MKEKDSEINYLQSELESLVKEKETLKNRLNELEQIILDYGMTTHKKFEVETIENAGKVENLHEKKNQIKQESSEILERIDVKLNSMVLIIILL